MKLLIVDDQMSVVEGLKHGVNWSALGFDRIDTAYNAVDARRSLLADRTDIMLCDIEMPVESGLDLLKWMRSQGMETRCIFLTAHAEFNYAQEAIKLGGFDYIVQPAPYEEVRKAVIKAVKDVEQGREQDDLKRMGKAFHQQEQSIAGNELRKYLLGNSAERDLVTLENMGAFPKRKKNGYLILAQVIGWSDGEKPWEEMLVSGSLCNIAGEILEPFREKPLSAFMEENVLALLIQNAAGEEIPPEEMQKMTAFLESASRQYMHCITACYIDGPLPVSAMPEQWDLLVKEKDNNVTLKPGVFVMEKKEHSGQAYRVPQIRSWAGMLQEGYTEAMEKEGSAILDGMAEKGQLNAETLRLFYQDFMQMVYSAVEEKEDKGDRIFSTPEAMELCRDAMKNVENMKKLMHHVALFFLAPAEPDDQKAIVEKIYRYIGEHIDGELRRDELADYVHLNPDYMNRIFKKESGYTVKEYIISRKMEEARALLKTTSLPISFIAAKVGFSNFSHFSYTYKKYLGMTPQEERQNSDNA
jgi:two-component system response regulator YesN